MNEKAVSAGCGCGYDGLDRLMAARENDLAVLGDDATVERLAGRRLAVRDCLDDGALLGLVGSSSMSLGRLLSVPAASVGHERLRAGEIARYAVDELVARASDGQVVGKGWAYRPFAVREEARQMLEDRFGGVEPDHRAATVGPVARIEAARFAATGLTVPADYTRGWDMAAAMGAPGGGSVSRLDLVLEDGPLTLGQQLAVQATDGYVLVVAGPGSGKTRVVQERVGHLVDRCGVFGNEIAVVTFSRTAAAEVRRRVAARCGSEAIEGLWAGTFNSYSSRLVEEHQRRHGQQVVDGRFGTLDELHEAVCLDASCLCGGRSVRELHRLACVDRNQRSCVCPLAACKVCDGVPRWRQLGEDERKLVLKAAVVRVVGREGRDLRQWAGAAGEVISRAKTALVSVDEFAQAADTEVERLMGAIYRRYELELRLTGQLDYDGALVKAYALLRDDPGVAEAEQRRYVVVDEAQDVSCVQLALALQLSSRDGNLTLVGDPDQLIYGWRNADERHLFGFRESTAARLVRLEDNFRSTRHIVGGYDGLIKANVNRLDRHLRSVRGDGHRIKLVSAADEAEEARFVAGEVVRLVEEETASTGGPYFFGDVLVLFRNREQRAALEEAFLRHGIPFTRDGQMSFFGRKEVKELVSVLALVAGVDDEPEITRIALGLFDGVGRLTLDRVGEIAAREGTSMWAVAVKAEDYRKELRQRAAVAAAVAEVEALRALADGDVVELLEKIIRVTGYRRKDGGAVANIIAFTRLLSICRDRGDGLVDVLDGVRRNLGGRLVGVGGLQGHVDAVELSTMHGAKGKEAAVVFVVGLEEGVLPDGRAVTASDVEVEAERRVMFVAMSRAGERLYLGWARARAHRGIRGPSLPSRFLSGLPAEHLDAEDLSGRVDSGQLEGLCGVVAGLENWCGAEGGGQRAWRVGELRVRGLGAIP